MYISEYRKTTLHKNAKALNKLPFGKDPVFDNEEGEEDVDLISAIHALESQLKPASMRKIRRWFG